MKRYFVAVIFCVVCAYFLFANGNEEKKRLVCDSNGDFTVLVVSDPQCDTETQWIEARNELETLIAKSTPNLVMILGDMNSDNNIPEKMWKEFVAPITKRGLYFATVNGNHDPFTETYYRMYRKYERCLNSKVSTLDVNYEATRPMNYVLPVYSSDNKRVIFAIYAMDTGTSNKYGYEGLTKKQIEWYKVQSDSLKEANKQKSVPSLLCMHIPLTQTIDMYYSKNASGQKNFGILNEKNHGITDYTCSDGTFVGKTRFHATAPQNDRGMFEAIKKQDDIRVVVFGHMHKTNLAGMYQNVLMGFAGKISTGCYYDLLCRGGRVIKINESNPERITVSWIGSLETSKSQQEMHADG